MTKVKDLPPICRETHEELVAWLEGEGIHMTLDRKQALYQWLEKYADARQRELLEAGEDVLSELEDERKASGRDPYGSETAERLRTAIARAKDEQ